MTDERELEKITIRLPSEDIRRIDFLVAIGEFSSRSEVIRVAIREMICAKADEMIKRSKTLENMDREIEERENKANIAREIKNQTSQWKDP